jgi:hypothetical protein
LALVLLSIMLYSVALPVHDSGPPLLLHRRLADTVQSAFASLSGKGEKVSRELLGHREGEEILFGGRRKAGEVIAQPKGISGDEKTGGLKGAENYVSVVAGPKNTSHDGRLSENQNVPMSIQDVVTEPKEQLTQFEEQPTHPPNLVEESQDGETQRRPLATEKEPPEADCSKQTIEEEEPEYMANITNYDMLWKQGMWWVPEHPRPTMSIGVLVYKEKDSLLAAFETWRAAGLLEYADEVVVYYQVRGARVP